MATGRIGTTPVLQVRWSKAPNTGTTSLSGLDDNSVSLVYSVGYEAVYRNGVLLSRGNDYTATNGTTVTLIDATITGDIIEIFANQTVPLTDTFSQTVADGRFIKNTLTTTTGDIIYASAANTPARLAIGSSGQVLTVSGGIPSYATPAAGGMTLINTGGTSLTGASVTISSIPATYYMLKIFIENPRPATDTDIVMRFNSDSTANRYIYAGGATSGLTYNNTQIKIGDDTDSAAASQGLIYVEIPNYANTTTWKICSNYSFVNYYLDTTKPSLEVTYGAYNQTSAISAVTVKPNSGNWTSGTIYVYGVK